MKLFRRMVVVLMGIAMVVPSFGIVAAQQSTAPSAPTTQAPTTDATQELNKRVDQYKKDHKVELNTQQQAKIKGQCVASQDKIRKFLTKMDTVEENHSKAYQDITEQYSTMANRLSERRIKVIIFRVQIVTLTGLVNTFANDMTAFKQALEDATAIGCVNDPAGFQSTVEAVRSSQTKVAKEAADIKKYVNETIKKTVEDLRKQLVNIGGGQ